MDKESYDIILGNIAKSHLFIKQRILIVTEQLARKNIMCEESIQYYTTLRINDIEQKSKLEKAVKEFKKLYKSQNKFGN